MFLLFFSFHNKQRGRFYRTNWSVSDRCVGVQLCTWVCTSSHNSFALVDFKKKSTKRWKKTEDDNCISEWHDYSLYSNIPLFFCLCSLDVNHFTFPRPEVEVNAKHFFGYFCPQKLIFTKNKRDFQRKLTVCTVIPAYLTGHAGRGVCVCALNIRVTSQS